LPTDTPSPSSLTRSLQQPLSPLLPSTRIFQLQGHILRHNIPLQAPQPRTCSPYITTSSVPLPSHLRTEACSVEYFTLHHTEEEQRTHRLHNKSGLIVLTPYAMLPRYLCDVANSPSPSPSHPIPKHPRSPKTRKPASYLHPAIIIHTKNIASTHQSQPSQTMKTKTIPFIVPFVQFPFHSHSNLSGYSLQKRKLVFIVHIRQASM